MQDTFLALSLVGLFTLGGLLSASAGGLHDVVELLIDRGTSLAFADSGGVSPVLYPAIEGHRDVAQLLIKGALRSTFSRPPPWVTPPP